jgi:RNA polymerase sigma-70 factor (ECF subfamily)
MGLGEHDAEDVAQEVVLRLLGTAGRYDPRRAALSTLVYRMTVNAVHDFRARPSRREVGADTTAMLSLPAAGANRETRRPAERELRDIVADAVELLPERQRQVCALHDLEGLSIAETAAALEITATNVRVHLTHARRALRQRLAHLLEG